MTSTNALQLVEPIVSTQWLADHLGSDGLVVLDATVLLVQNPAGGSSWLSGYDQYLVAGHVPGAVFADILEVFSDPRGSFGFAKPSAAQFEAAAASVGVDNNTTVVVYDTAVGQWASRIWWLFRAFGYDNVAVLDGGLAKWNDEERPLEFGHLEPRSASFTAAERPELWADKAYVESVVAGTEDAALVCASPRTDFTGETSPRSRAGHIPGSVNVPAGRLIDRESNAYLDGATLHERFAPVAGSGHRIVTYCGGGIAAASAALALTLLGERDVAVYDGSLNEWAADAEAPLETAAV
ncbi:sulfurtransferase [Compostimonas suwonensis]|uniref:Thiosulfate/3-mercaptopyruvate sulfurtransferase n=1 Tax=Compostimonas suwonensis TaxID=1048394 RepID=A0A2M9BW12_9MICO|nr:rhodanese-like domain-containing protein [Compostimonas suwonensis]PJJ62119.1 thiosulfate/3-mercaptopyruvate sulfurtransferase [Compostimonas suwonensis]